MAHVPTALGTLDDRIHKLHRKTEKLLGEARELAERAAGVARDARAFTCPDCGFDGKHRT
jgi:hypothetical protein